MKKSLDLSLVEIDSEPVPLQIYHPRDFPPSRIPGCILASELHNVASVKPKSKESQLNCLRRSPRFSFKSSHEPTPPQKISERKKPSCPSLSLVKRQSQCMALKEGEECLKAKVLRRSSRLSAVGRIDSSCYKAALEIHSLQNCNSKLSTTKELEANPLISLHADNGTKSILVAYGGMNLRRSPRFMMPTQEGINNESIRNCGRVSGSQRNSQQSSVPHNIKINSVCNGLPDSLDEHPFKRVKTFPENSDLGMLDGELLMQSPRTTNSSSGVENGKIKCSLTELSQSCEMHFQKEKSDKYYPSEKIKPLSSKKKQKKHKIVCCLVGDPVPSDEAQERWHWRYEMKTQRSNHLRPILDDDGEDKIVWNVECHYTQAEIDGCIFSLGDCAYIKGEGGKKHVGKIVEFFKTTDGEDYFRVQWFYRVEDTVIKEEGAFHDKKRLFYSTVMNDNPIDCILSKVIVVHMSPTIGSKTHPVSPSDFYFDMEYSVDYSSFRTMPIGSKKFVFTPHVFTTSGHSAALAFLGTALPFIDDSFKKQNSSLSNVVEPVSLKVCDTSWGNMPSGESYKAELALLDLFSGCGGMSTGLCLGAKVSSVDLVTRWALDSDKSACESLKLNHPETHVRNEAAEDFLKLLKDWEKLCKKYVGNDVEQTRQSRSMTSIVAKKNEDSPGDDDSEYEVSRLVDVCYGDPDETGHHGLKFKVRWKGYSSSEDTWEPIDGLSNCQECIREFVKRGFKSKILPLPGDVDVICGGPPCQGISGYNRYRNVDSPLADERNRQIVVFMDIVQFLKPKFVLMENVVDILRFDKASLARYALSRLVHMKYQARLGTIAAGCYGLPQFRLRVFVWGAHPSEKLPQFPLPSHDVIVRYWPPPEFERNTVAYDEEQPRELEKASVLQDAISDLPPVSSHENREEISYEKPPETEFQRFIRSMEYEMTGCAQGSTSKLENLLYDHRPYSLTEEDHARVCLIPKRKGANFRDLPGVVVGSDNVARRDPTKKQIMLPSGKPLVPDFAFTFEQGKSKRPYARLWWDETVSTVVTYPDLHNQVVVHPEQDRVLTIRECARLQGFPDYYRFSGTVKKRYRQVGNAVAVPVGRALGYALGMAFRKLSTDEPLMRLPPKFSHSTYIQLTKSLIQKTD